MALNFQGFIEHHVPPIIFDWNDDTVVEFIAKVSALPANAVACPFPLSAVPLTTGALKQSLLAYVQTLVPGCGSVGGNSLTTGLACSKLLCGAVAANLANLQNHPWFAAVLSTRPALTGPLATVLMARPPVATGAWDALPLHCVLWE